MANEKKVRGDVLVRAKPGYTIKHERILIDGSAEKPEERQAVLPVSVAEGYRGRAEVKIDGKFQEIPPKDRQLEPGEQLHRMIESPRKSKG